MYSLKKSIDIRASAEAVWEALVNPEKVKQYYFGTELVTDWNVGDSIVYRGEYQGKPYEHKGQVLQVVPFRLLQHTTWSASTGQADQPENYQTITYMLETVGDLTRLTVSEENLPTREIKDRSEQYWEQILDGLKKTVDGRRLTVDGTRCTA